MAILVNLQYTLIHMTRLTAPRLTVTISNQQEADLNEVIPYGMKRTIFIALVDLIIEQLRFAEDPRTFLGDLLSGRIKLRYADGSTEAPTD